ncbi:hypothetical protein L484_010660 [Morus notabilis]|uniref:Uncharacterized protein n=1 Tax=Morus notabilis TaxID=981085 RepID=W9RZS6_9ROSA|nr:hypothetical protein L484_010660 [Morus notabilis]
MGSPTHVVITGQAGNKFVLAAEDDVLAAKQPLNLQATGGKQTSHDTSAILMSLIIWKLSRDPEVYKKVLDATKNEVHVASFPRVDEADSSCVWQLNLEKRSKIQAMVGMTFSRDGR